MREHGFYHQADSPGNAPHFEGVWKEIEKQKAILINDRSVARRPARPGTTSQLDPMVWRVCAGNEMARTDPGSPKHAATTSASPGPDTSRKAEGEDEKESASEATSGRSLQSDYEETDSPLHSERASMLRERQRARQRLPSQYSSTASASISASAATSPSTPPSSTGSVSLTEEVSNPASYPVSSSVSKCSSSGNIYEQAVAPSQQQEDPMDRYKLCNCERLETTGVGAYVSRSIEEYSGIRAPLEMYMRQRPVTSPTISEIISRTTASSASQQSLVATPSTPKKQQQVQPQNTTTSSASGTKNAVNTTGPVMKIASSDATRSPVSPQTPLEALPADKCASALPPSATTSTPSMTWLQAELRCWLGLLVFVFIVYLYHMWLPETRVCPSINT
ncbi:unnamed protein product, partial [Mesorhabditis spiculigera]